MGERRSDRRERNHDCVALNQCIGEIKVIEDAPELSTAWYSMSQKEGAATKLYFVATPISIFEKTRLIAFQKTENSG
ncbi:hypothetical protein [Lacticaseibacillus saniviri]